jgi:hypothetical protein
MNGLKMNLKTDNTYPMDSHTFRAPSNVILPDSVGKI